MAHYSVTIVAAAISLATLRAVSWAGAGGEDADPVPIIRPLVGSTVPQVVRRLGRPFMVIPLRETGGKLMFFENPRGDRYVIETDVSERVIKAAVKHPENR
jgi:hypothetical protein